MGRSEYHKVLFQAAKDMPKFWLPRQHETSANRLSLSYLCCREVMYKCVSLDSGILDSSVCAVVYEGTQDESAELCLMYCAPQENIASGRGIEAEMVLSFTSCYISLSTTPLCNISSSAIIAVHIRQCVLGSDVFCDHEEVESMV